jgi:hypothetical protein
MTTNRDLRHQRDLIVALIEEQLGRAPPGDEDRIRMLEDERDRINALVFDAVLASEELTDALSRLAATTASMERVAARMTEAAGWLENAARFTALARRVRAPAG